MLARRDFLKISAMLLAAPREFARAPLSPVEFRRALRGPIVSIPTPFTADRRLDLGGLERMVRRALAQGIEWFELTAGDSQYSWLSYEEIKELAVGLVRAAGDRGKTILGTGAWWTSRVIDYVKHVEAAGGTAVQVLLPSGGDEDEYVRHYRQVAAATRLPIVLHGNYPLRLLDRLAEIEAIAALKEDVSLSYYIDTAIRYGGRLNCFSGGAYEWFLTAQPYGATAYFDSYATFAPQISARFWKAIETGNIVAEREIIERYDHPFIARFSHPFWHATLEYFGVAGRYLRPPQHTYTDEEMKSVKEFYESQGLRPEKVAR